MSGNEWLGVNIASSGLATAPLLCGHAGEGRVEGRREGKGGT